MSHQDEETDEFSLMLAERLRKVRQNRDSSGECSPRKPFRHLDMIFDMQVKARKCERDFLEDVLRLVGVYWKYGSNNTVRILQDFDGTPELKERLIDMIDVYDIVDGGRHHKYHPTLSRIAEAFPQISLVLASRINADPSMGLKLWVSDRDLGVQVHYLFKLHFFPGLIYVASSVKAQACLLLFNLCHARGILNRFPENNSKISAFTHSCKFSTNIMEQRLAQLESRLKFTDYIEAIAPSAELMYRVWTKVIGEQQVPLTDVTSVTRLHETALRSQPLFLVTWKRLLAENYET